MSQDILVHAEAGVMTITLNRLARKNSITSDMYAALADAVARAQQDDTVRVALIQGHETVFSAGNDIGDFLDKPPAGSASCTASPPSPSRCWPRSAARRWA